MGTQANSHAQIIPLPKCGGVLRGLREKFSPDLITGTAHSIIPITVLLVVTASNRSSISSTARKMVIGRSGFGGPLVFPASPAKCRMASFATWTTRRIRNALAKRWKAGNAAAWRLQ